MSIFLRMNVSSFDKSTCPFLYFDWMIDLNGMSTFVGLFYATSIKQLLVPLSIFTIVLNTRLSQTYLFCS